MKITKNTVPSIAYKVKTTDDNQLVDIAEENAPLDYLHGHQNLIIGLENALEGRTKGETFSIDIPFAEAYGDYDENLVQRVPTNLFDTDELHIGMRFLADTDQGPIPVEVTDIEGDFATVDGNHMLAGRDLTFDVKIINVREATDEEIEQGEVDNDDDCCGDSEDCCSCGHN